MEYNFTYREKDGNVQVILSYKDTNGKWHQRSKQGFKKKSDAKEAGKKLLKYVEEKELHLDGGKSKNITLGAFEETFLANMNNVIEYNTIAVYRQAFKAFAGLKNKQIVDITFGDIAEIYNAFPYKASTSNLYLRKLKTMLNYAIKPYKLIKENPANDIILKVDKEDKKNNALTKERLEKLLNSLRLKNNTVYVIANIAAYAGLRIGEILGLKWSDIDTNTRTITVARQHVLKNKKDYEQREPKSKNSYRTIPIPILLNNILKAYRGSEDVIDFKGKVFIGMGNSNVNHWLARVENDVTIHDLRHTYATNLLANGVDIKTIAALIGDTVETVSKTYVHYNDDMRQKAKVAVDQIFG